MTLFPFAEYWWIYAVFNVLVLVMLVVDLGIFHRKAHEVSIKEAGIWTAVWIALAMVFNAALYLYSAQKFDPATAKQVALEFFTGFLVEKSLAIDNVFVFAVVFSYFGIPRLYQHRVLFFGILGALFFRALFVALGSYLMAYKGVVIFFGLLLMLTGIKMFFAPDKMMDPEKNVLLRLLKRVFPIHPKLEGDKFLVKIGGVTHLTPLFVALIFLEFTDIIFAVDSVPAIFALTDEPLIVFTSNMFAILGLRSMYFLLSDVMNRFAYIKYGLAAVLVFVGLKMVWLNEHFGGKFPIAWSLGIIAALLTSSVIVPLVVQRLRGARA